VSSSDRIFSIDMELDRFHVYCWSLAWVDQLLEAKELVGNISVEKSNEKTE